MFSECQGDTNSEVFKKRFNNRETIAALNYEIRQISVITPSLL